MELGPELGLSTISLYNHPLSVVKHLRVVGVEFPNGWVLTRSNWITIII